jgi:2-keto-4-pentenoate hydratase/2-oxohepta-3-ene-1,7-dioic acid hydratase in catechol pathway
VRLANVGGRAALVVGDRVVDVERASGGRFGADPQALFGDWAAFRGWAEQATDAAAPADAGQPIDPGALGAPVPRPRQVFAIGVNYTEHAAEAGYPPDSVPVTFTKFPSCIVGQDVAVELPSDVVDWEVELVVAIGVAAHRVAASDAWEHVAGVTIGQDLSERVVQMVGTKPQFSLGKSFPGFGPTGPWLVTPDELPARDDLELSCDLDGEVMQTGRTSQMIYTVPQLVERLSAIVTLLPGDLVFTGTPAGIGNARTPKRFLEPHETLTSRIEGIGTLTTTFRR